MREVTFLEAIRLAMWEEMERDPNVFMIGEDIGRMGGAFGATRVGSSNTSEKTA